MTNEHTHSEELQAQLLFQAKERAEQSEARLKFAQLASKAGTWDWNIAENTFYWSPEFLAVFGFPEDQKPGFESWTSRLHPDDVEAASHRIQECIANQTDLINDYRIVLPNKEIRWIRATGKTYYENNIPVRMTGLCQDITELKKSEQELLLAKEKAEQNEKKYQMLFNTLSEGVALNEIVYNEDHEMVDYRIIEVNKAYYTASGIEGIDVVGCLATQLYGMSSEFIKAFWQEHKKKTTTAYTEFANETNTKFYYISTSPFVDDTFVTSFIDITAIKQAEKALKEQNEILITAKEQAEESNHLKTAFLQNISHEIRTPMNAICGFADLLGKPELSEERRNRFVTIIKNNASQLLSIVTDILTISSLETKQEKANISKVDLNTLIQDLLAVFKPQAHHRNLSLYAKAGLTGRESVVLTDQTKVTQVLTNLISNALKFTHSGSVEFGYSLNPHNETKELLFYVKDSGIGIQPEQLGQIFERFVQADVSINRHYGGTGLGLSISKGFVEILSGRIWVESSPGNGSAFYFTIPYLPSEETPAGNKPKAQYSGKGTILVAEDEQYNYLLIQEVFSDSEIELIHAKDGQETLEKFKSNDGIGLVLMDIKMPFMNGDECAKKIRALRPEVPIIAQSAYALDHEIEQYGSIFDAYIKKPIEVNELRSKVHKHLFTTDT